MNEGYRSITRGVYTPNGNSFDHFITPLVTRDFSSRFHSCFARCLSCGRLCFHCFALCSSRQFSCCRALIGPAGCGTSDSFLLVDHGWQGYHESHVYYRLVGPAFWFAESAGSPAESRESHGEGHQPKWAALRCFKSRTIPI